MPSTLREIESGDTAFVLLFDPKDLAGIPIDPLRRGIPFDVLLSSTEPQAVLLKSEERRIRVTVQPARLEFVQEERSPFGERSLDQFQGLLESLPELSVKALGINYTIFFTVDGYGRAGDFIRDRFLKQPTGLESVLKDRIISNSNRVIFGEPDEYRDLRFHPADLASNRIVFQYHYHRDEVAKDKDRILRLLSEQYRHEIEQLENLMKLI